MPRCGEVDIGDTSNQQQDTSNQQSVGSWDNNPPGSREKLHQNPLGGPPILRKTEFDPADPRQRKRWLKALKNTGVESVRIRLNQSTGGSRSSLTGIGTELDITRGFAEAWLDCQNRRRHLQTIIISFASAVAATVGAAAAAIAAWPVIKGWWSP